jgi:nicotinamidase-related amidase
VREVFGKPVCETLEEVLSVDHSALVVVDMQNDAVLPEGRFAKAGKDISGMLKIRPLCGRFIQEARRLNVLVIHVRTVTLPDGRSDSPSWLRAKAGLVNVTEFMLPDSWGAEFCTECAPLPGEPIVTKLRSSAFVGTDLDLILRVNDIRTVVVIGQQTPGCVEATYRDAAYHDYYNVLIEDCVAAFEPELHEASLKIQRARHDVCRSDEAIAIWQAQRKRSRAIDEIPVVVG